MTCCRLYGFYELVLPLLSETLRSDGSLRTWEVKSVFPAFRTDESVCHLTEAIFTSRRNNIRDPQWVDRPTNNFAFSSLQGVTR